jgi:hypothetical protein
VRIYKDQTERSSTDFLRRLHQAAPMLISKILTENGSQFTDRFTARQRVPSVQHVFDKACLALNIEHRLSPPRHPQTNGMVERFNGRITAVVQQTRFTSAAQLEATLTNCAKTCNSQLPQRALNHLSPVQALKHWHARRPELFVKRAKDHPDIDNYRTVDSGKFTTRKKVAVVATHVEPEAPLSRWRSRRLSWQVDYFSQIQTGQRCKWAHRARVNTVSRRILVGVAAGQVAAPAPQGL